MNEKVEAKIRIAVSAAIKEMGISEFRKTSFFMSNNAASEALKLAA